MNIFFSLVLATSHSVVPICPETMTVKVVPIEIHDPKNILGPELELQLDGVSVYSRHPSEWNEIHPGGETLFSAAMIKENDVWIACEYDFMGRYTVKHAYKIEGKDCHLLPDAVNIVCQ